MEAYAANQGIYLPVEMIDIGGASKRRRIMQMEPLARNHKLYVHETMVEFEREWNEFPDNIKAVGGKRLRMDHHYDMLDAGASCVPEALSFEHIHKAPPKPRNTVSDYIKALRARNRGVQRLDRLYRA